MFDLVLVRIWKKEYNKGVGSREGSGTLMSNIDYQGIEN